LVAEIQGTLKAKKLKPGDKIKAQLTQDVILHGKIVAPADSKILGHVTEAKAASDSDRSSRLGIVFDKILLKHHRVLDFKGVIQALAPPSMRNSKVDEPSQMLPPSLMGGGQQNSGQLPGGRTPSSTRNSGGNTPSGGQAGSAMSSIPITAPVRVKTTPGGNPGDGVGGLESPKGAEPISAGLPQGVFGIRGLALSSTPSADTPGPVILSQSGDIKLEWGTQVLLRVAGTAPPPQ
jgi:hypothetical protein